MKSFDISLELKKVALKPDIKTFTRLEKQAHPVDIAMAFSTLSSREQRLLMGLASPSSRAGIFMHLSDEVQVNLARRINRQQLTELLVHLPADERADLYNNLPDAIRENAMRALARAEREDIRRLAAYPEKAVGAVMTSDLAILRREMTAREAVAELRRLAPERESIYQAYVVDDRQRLIGAVSLRQLIVAAPETLVARMMTTNPVFVRAYAPRAEAVRLIRRYDLLAVPVVNDKDELAGIVTYDDAMDVEQAEGDRDFRKIGAVGNLGVGLKDAPIGLLYRKRVFWLLLLVFVSIFSGAGIAHFEDTILAHVALVFFLPLLIGSGGNAGAQAATLMVRALATGDAVLGDWARLALRESAVAGLLGATMALVVAGLGLWRGGPEIALVVALSMQVIVILGGLIGLLLPFLLSRLKLDPATASVPLITTIADMVGVIIYFVMASSLLRLPT